MKPLIKVCGMTRLDNVIKIAALQPDFIGFIFYKKSKRKVEDESLNVLLNILPPSTKKIAVVVNEKRDRIFQLQHKFDFVQLHGDESAKFCKELNEKGVKIIKAFGVDEDFDFDVLNGYLPYCKYFLFDTKTVTYGGSGKKYNWQKLEEYKLALPFFLSGGIGLEDAEAIKELKHPQLYAVDINSKFEIKAGLKNVELVDTFLKKIRE